MSQINFVEIFEWWRDLANARDNKKARFDYTSADSALLRRAKSVNDVILKCPVYFKLLERIKGEGDDFSFEQQKKLALIAGVLSHIKTNEEKKILPKHLKNLGGNLREKNNSIELRFRRLLQTSTSEEIFTSMIRIIKLVGEKEIDVKHLATSLYYWTDPETKKQWAYSFY
jgi:CRISPR type I-E-associated protein CasB/Cse2